MIEKGKVISVHYIGKLTENGEVFDSSEGRDPITFQVGSGQIIPGFENPLIGKNVGDKVETGTIKPEEAYGSVREDLIVEVDKNLMPGEVQVGMVLEAASENGQAIPVKVVEVTDEKVKVDGNHPLAGKEIQFEIEVVGIED